MPGTDQTRLREDQRLAELLAPLDEFLRSRDLPVAELLVEFMKHRGSQHAAFDAYNLVDHLCFTAHRYRGLISNPSTQPRRHPTVIGAS